METAMSLHPIDHNVVCESTHYTSPRDRIAAALQRALAFSRSPAKELARALGRTPNGAALLLRGDVSPQLETLIAACRQYDEVWEVFRDLCGRADSIGQAEQLLAEITAKLKERRVS